MAASSNSQGPATQESYKKGTVAIKAKNSAYLYTYLSYFQYGRSPHEYSVTKKVLPSTTILCQLALNRQVECQLQKFQILLGFAFFRLLMFVEEYNIGGKAFISGESPLPRLGNVAFSSYTYKIILVEIKSHY